MYNGYLEQSLLMVARRRQKSKKICYAIGTERKHNEENIIGKLKSNLLGNSDSFIIYYIIFMNSYQIGYFNRNTIFYI